MYCGFLNSLTLTQTGHYSSCNTDTYLNMMISVRKDYVQNIIIKSSPTPNSPKKLTSSRSGKWTRLLRHLEKETEFEATRSRAQNQQLKFPLERTVTTPRSNLDLCDVTIGHHPPNWPAKIDVPSHPTISSLNCFNWWEWVEDSTEKFHDHNLRTFLIFSAH